MGPHPGTVARARAAMAALAERAHVAHIQRTRRPQRQPPRAPCSRPAVLSRGTSYRTRSACAGHRSRSSRCVQAAGAARWLSWTACAPGGSATGGRAASVAWAQHTFSHNPNNVLCAHHDVCELVYTVCRYNAKGCANHHFIPCNDVRTTYCFCIAFLLKERRDDSIALLFCKRFARACVQTSRRRRRDDRSGSLHISVGRGYSVEDATGKDAVVARQGHGAATASRQSDGYF